MKKIISTLLITATLFGSSLMVSAEKVQSFKDVEPSDWYYESVSAMTEMGYFAGKGEIVNGIGAFAPNDTMTKAEFLTVTARIVFDEVYLTTQSEEGAEWWEVYYDSLLNAAIIDESEFREVDIHKGISREEMALVSMRVLEYKGENVNNVPVHVAYKKIPDIQSVGVHYKEYVLGAYCKGILCGTDDIGTFSPKNTLNRAEASTVLYRIVDSSKRTPLKFEASDFSDTSTTPSNPSSSIPKVNPNNGKTVPSELVDSSSTVPITIYEGQRRSNRPAKEGDTFVKADGTKVIVKKDANGLVGGGQHLRLDQGLVYNGPRLADTLYGAPFTYDRLQGSFMWTDSFGNDINNIRYGRNFSTGEYHWDSEWNRLCEIYPMPTYKGKAGETSTEGYELYYWDATSNRWESNIVYF